MHAFTLTHESDTFPLFRNLGGATFEDVTTRSGLAALSRAWTGWGNGVVDLNNDGWKDLFAACSGVRDPDGRFRGRVAMANAVFVNVKGARFAAESVSQAFTQKAIHRGAAFGDIDNDGRVDVVGTVGRKSNRDGMGAKIKVVTPSGPQYNHVNTAVGYGSASDRRVHFGLTDSTIQELTITWPSGKTQTVKNVAPDQVLTVREPE